MTIKTLSPCPPRWICKSTVFHVPRHTSFSEWPWAYVHLHSLSWLVVGTNRVLHKAEPRGGDGKYTKRIQEGRLSLLGHWPTPTSQECTICCLFNKCSCLLELWLVGCFESLLQWDKGQEILPAWAVVSPSFQIFVMMEQEPREINKWPDGYIWHNSGTLPKPEKCHCCNAHI